MNSGDIAWMLISTALVVFMVPGLALFYGGMDKSKNVLNMLNMNMYCIGIVPLLWVTLSWTLGNSSDGSGFWGGDLIGNWDQIGLKTLNLDSESLIFVAFSSPLLKKSTPRAMSSPKTIGLSFQDCTLITSSASIH